MRPFKTKPPQPSTPLFPSSFPASDSTLTQWVGWWWKWKMDSSTPGAPGASGSKDSIHGLKFGKKIYFEDVAVAAGGSSSKPANSAPAAPAAGGKSKKGRGGAAHGGQPPPPPRCQVEGCNEDLTGAKTYYCRHKVCGMHSKSPKVIVAGKEQRFCQQCSRFHLLPEFDQGKRSCRRRLAGHNERRRKPPPGPLSRYGRLASPFHQNGGRFEGFLMDFSYPKLSGTTRDMWQTNQTSNRASTYQWQGTMDVTPIRIAGQPLHPYDHSSAGVTLFSDHGISPSQCLAVSDSSCALSLLSNQPWGTNATSARSPMISADSFEGTPVAQAPPLATGFVGNCWNLREHETSGGGMANEVSPDVGLGLTAETSDRHFSGELELALQGKRQCIGSGHDRAYCPGNMTQWSL